MSYSAKHWTLFLLWPERRCFTSKLSVGMVWGVCDLLWTGGPAGSDWVTHDPSVVHHQGGQGTISHRDTSSGPRRQESGDKSIFKDQTIHCYCTQCPVIHILFTGISKPQSQSNILSFQNRDFDDKNFLISHGSQDNIYPWEGSHCIDCRGSYERFLNGSWQHRARWCRDTLRLSAELATLHVRCGNQSNIQLRVLRGTYHGQDTSRSCIQGRQTRWWKQTTSRPRLCPWPGCEAGTEADPPCQTFPLFYTIITIFAPHWRCVENTNLKTSWIQLLYRNILLTMVHHGMKSRYNTEMEICVTKLRNRTGGRHNLLLDSRQSCCLSFSR